MREKNHNLILLGERIRGLRAAKGYSQESFAADIEFARSYVSAVERGVSNPAALNLMRIAKVLGVEVGELFPPLKSIED